MIQIKNKTPSFTIMCVHSTHQVSSPFNCANHAHLGPHTVLIPSLTMILLVLTNVMV